MSLHIQTYTAFKTKSHLYIKGRILKNKPIESKYTGTLMSLYYTAIRAWTREVSDVPMIIQYDATEYELTTDCEGYFDLFTEIGESDVKNADIKLSYKNNEKKGVIEIMNLSNHSETVVISDIDDTIMVTGVKSFFKIKLIINTLFVNPFRRKPIQSAAQAFQFLSQQNSTIIYLSNSPWNLYNYLNTFLEYNEFPQGIVILRDMGLQLLKSRSIQDGNKYKEIERMIIMFSYARFILIGDTGEKDYDIYTALQNKYPKIINRIILNAVGNKQKEIKINSAGNNSVELVYGYDKLLPK